MKHRSLFAGLLVASLLFAVAPLHAADLQMRAGPGRVTVIELYTSEGCSSCPPAEDWLRTLADNPALWSKVVPIAFHVTYWDNLGWLDRFSEPAFTQRQYGYVRKWGISSVYTPCFAWNGREWRPNDSPPQARGTPGILSATVATDGRCTIKFEPTAGLTGPFEAQIALLGGGIASKVKAGENSGRNLRHEFVALGLATKDLAPVEGAFRAALTLPSSPIHSARRAVAIWVSRPGDPAPLQATGGWLPSGA